MKGKSATRNTTKIVELRQELGLSDAKWLEILNEVNIRLEERQKNLDQNEVGRVRKYLKEQSRRAALRKQTIMIPSIIKVQGAGRTTISASW